MSHDAPPPESAVPSSCCRDAAGARATSPPPRKAESQVSAGDVASLTPWRTSAALSPRGTPLLLRALAARLQSAGCDEGIVICRGPLSGSCRGAPLVLVSAAIAGSPRPLVDPARLPSTTRRVATRAWLAHSAALAGSLCCRMCAWHHHSLLASGQPIAAAHDDGYYDWLIASRFEVFCLQALQAFRALSFFLSLPEVPPRSGSLHVSSSGWRGAERREEQTGWMAKAATVFM